MRKNSAEVINAAKNGKPLRKCEAIWTDGNSIYSYATCLLTVSSVGIIYNDTKYSPTTSRHQHALRMEFSNPESTLTNLSRGVTAADLMRLAKHY